MFQLPNRTDESEQSCRFQEAKQKATASKVLASAKECVSEDSRPGLTCEDECVSFQDWCDKRGTEHVTKCGALLQQAGVCRNGSFWTGKPCGRQGRRCTGWWPGECDHGLGCRDKSEDGDGWRDKLETSQCLAGGDRLENVSDTSWLCPDLYLDKVNVCATRCNRVSDGCEDDVDEKNCSYGSHTLLLISLLFTTIFLTFLLIELIFWMSRKTLQNSHSQSQSVHIQMTEEDSSMMRKFKAIAEPDEDLAKHISSFCSIILDKNNWDLGVRDDSSLLSPYWHEGGFTVKKLSQLRMLYKEIRDSSVEFSLRFLVFFIQRIIKEEEEDIIILEAEALSHYCHALIYNVLEREYLEECSRFNKNVDISIKESLSTRHSGDFYGQVFPYFDPVRTLKKIIQCSRTLQALKVKICACSGAIPEIVKYVFIVSISILGWYMDFIKDIFIANDLMFLFTTFWDFKSQIVIILWITVFLSQTIIGIWVLFFGPSRIFGEGVKRLTTTQKVLINLTFFFLSPLAPAILLYLNKRLERKIRLRDKALKNMFEEEVNEVNCKAQLAVFANREEIINEKRKLETIISSSYQIDNVLENTPQLFIQLLIVLMSASVYELPWVTGIEAVFDTHQEEDSLATVLFFFSIGWSLKSIYIGLLTTFLFKKEYSIGDTGKVLLFLLFFLGSTSRLLALICFFCPYLGLFNIMLPFITDVEISYSDHVREYIGDDILTTMNHPDWYTGLSWHYAGVSFLVFPIVHMVLVMVYKSITINGFLRLSSKHHTCGRVKMFYQRLIHCLNGLLVPIIWKDWDEREQKTVTDFYHLEWENVRREYRNMTILFCMENILFCVPMLHTCVRIIQRYNIISPLDHEEHILTVAKILLAMPGLFLLLAFLQLKLFVLYNLKGHPWARLLVIKNEENDFKQ